MPGERLSPSPMRLLPILLLALLPSLPARASAIYTYREKDGTIVYTNVPPRE